MWDTPEWGGRSALIAGSTFGGASIIPIPAKGSLAQNHRQLHRQTKRMFCFNLAHSAMEKRQQVSGHAPHKNRKGPQCWDCQCGPAIEEQQVQKTADTRSGAGASARTRTWTAIAALPTATRTSSQVNRRSGLRLSVEREICFRADGADERYRRSVGAGYSGARNGVIRIRSPKVRLQPMRPSAITPDPTTQKQPINCPSK